ncbi:hypothetical protein CHISP_0413 [Chitinispirillum alkaliphilum]|nr:hypothetical protein CHISP_0413 [Chitinispirillum alkaliphilum]
MILYHHMRREMSTRFIALEDECLIKKTSKTIQRISYTDIESIKHLYIPFIKGFIILKSKKGGCLILPLFIRNCSALLEQIRINMSRSIDATCKISEKEWAKLKKTAYQHDISRERHFRLLYPLVRITVLFSVAGTFVASQYWGMLLLPALLFGLSGIFFPTTAYLISDYLLINTNRDLKEKNELLFALLISILVYMIAGIVTTRLLIL